MAADLVVAPIGHEGNAALGSFSQTRDEGENSVLSIIPRKGKYQLGVPPKDRGPPSGHKWAHPKCKMLSHRTWWTRERFSCHQSITAFPACHVCFEGKVMGQHFLIYWLRREVHHQPLPPSWDLPTVLMPFGHTVWTTGSGGLENGNFGDSVIAVACIR